MEENNKTKLDALINQTLDALELDPMNEELIDKLEVLSRLSISDYAEASKAYSQEMKAEAEKEKFQMEMDLKKQELEIREAELAHHKKDAVWNRILKGLGIAAPFTIGMATIHADRIGEYVHKIALPWASKFVNKD